MPLAEALDAFAHVGSGQFSHDDKCFFPENAVLGPVADRIRLLHRAERRVVRGCEGEADMTLFLVGGAIAALVSGKRLRSQWLEEARRDAGGLETLPDFIALRVGQCRSPQWRRRGPGSGSVPGGRCGAVEDAALLGAGWPPRAR